MNTKLKKAYRTSGYYNNENNIKSKLKDVQIYPKANSVNECYKITTKCSLQIFYPLIIMQFILNYILLLINKIEIEWHNISNNLNEYLSKFKQEIDKNNIIENNVAKICNRKHLINEKSDYKKFKLSVIIPILVFIFIVSENACEVNASVLLFSGSPIDLNNLPDRVSNNYNDYDKDQSSYNSDLLSAPDTIEITSETDTRTDFEEKILKQQQHDKDYSDKNQIALESAKLRHYANGNSNEHFNGKHESRRKFRSAGNTTAGKSKTSSNHLPTSDSSFKQTINNESYVGLGSSIYQKQQEQVQGFRIEGFRIEHSKREAEFGEDGVPEVLNGFEIVLRLFGNGITDNTVIIFTTEENTYGGSCLLPSTGVFRVTPGTSNGKTALVEVIFEKTLSNKDYLICAKSDELTDNLQNVTIVKPFVHQGSEPWLRIRSFQKLLPFWASLIIIVVCLIFSALFSGLNLGLMALDRTELKILRNTGTEKEREYAGKIQPVRDHGNFLLCSILLGNVLVNSTFTILLDDLTSGVIAVIFSTIAIVVFGEITPQAICSRHGLAVGAKTIYVTKAVMIITFPLSYPTSKILDYLLGEEIGNVYNRERLKELVRLTTDVNDLDKNEVNIISGALELRKKTVKNVMTHIEDAFMLSLDAILDFETVSEIMKSGFSRIPVYDGDDRKNIVTLLYIKDLAFVDPDDNTPLKTLCEFYQNPCHFVFEDVTLDIMFNQFKEGNKGHMAFVHRVNSEGDGDPFYETIGLVTLEDVIEELIQAEIIDETDVFIDNRTKKKRQKMKKQDFTVFAERRENQQQIRISPQLTLATFQYLSTSIDAFKKDTISETILRRLLNQDIVKHIKCKGKEKDDPSLLLFEQGKPVDFFVLILEGRVEVTVGRENLVFESGPFTYFGTQALAQNIGIESPSLPSQQIMGSLQSLNVDALIRYSFVPDYSVRATSDIIYIVIKRSLYLAAKRATLLEKTQKLGVEPSNEVIDDEVEKLLHSLDEDDRCTTHYNQPHQKNELNASNKNLSHSNANNLTLGNLNNDSNNHKDDSNTPSPTFPSVSIINLVRKKNQEGHKNDLIMYATKDCVQNGPTPASPNSLQTSFNQHSASLFGSQQTSNNSMAVALSKSPSGCGGGFNYGFTAIGDNSLMLPSLQIQKIDDSFSGERRSIADIGITSNSGAGSNADKTNNLTEIQNRKKNSISNQCLSNPGNISSKEQQQQQQKLLTNPLQHHIDSCNTAETPLLNDEQCVQQQQQKHQQNNSTNRNNSKC